ncbi:uncharacterized protein [Triticum aestivum]|uniref:uncharacterized protein isoform X1 n=1 Tax=Triticum aestivum TaxID=4565 RepID=UPI001D007A90|nr:uncharacterized protein LOC123149519 isoform X1 [Triticum aestivum]
MTEFSLSLRSDAATSDMCWNFWHRWRRHHLHRPLPGRLRECVRPTIKLVMTHFEFPSKSQPFQIHQHRFSTSRISYLWSGATKISIEVLSKCCDYLAHTTCREITLYYEDFKIREICRSTEYIPYAVD